MRAAGAELFLRADGDDESVSPPKMCKIVQEFL